MIAQQLNCSNISLCQALVRYEPRGYTQHWTTIGNLENLNLWSFQLVRKIKGRQNETQVKLVAFYFQSEISF